MQVVPRFTPDLSELDTEAMRVCIPRRANERSSAVAVLTAHYCCDNVRHAYSEKVEVNVYQRCS